MTITSGRLVRQDGTFSEVSVTDCSSASCNVFHELRVGELVSVEITDLALIVGHVSATQHGQSRIDFLGLGRH